MVDKKLTNGYTVSEKYIYIDMYIYVYRERERCIFIYRLSFKIAQETLCTHDINHNISLVCEAPLRPMLWREVTQRSRNSTLRVVEAICVVVVLYYKVRILEIQNTWTAQRKQREINREVIKTVK
jgi:hypothetical protein